MIYKELDAFSGGDKFEVAGRKAEEQMVHYLKRFFGSSAEVDVLNYLRVDLAGEVAQMDHLIVHPYGLLIVESKSVSGSVQIKDDGQWIRWFNKQPQGMRSPITQAKMQLMLLKEMLDRAVTQKGFFETVRMDVLVAISDSGTIQWPSSGALAEVCKADQVPERVLDRIQQLRRSGKELLQAGHRRTIAEFLMKVHRPLGSNGSETSAAPNTAVKSAKVTEEKEANSLPEKVCKHCGGTSVAIRHGQFGYYFACKACEKNTAIKFKCPKCGGDGRIRKQGNEFFAECRVCDASSPFHKD